MDALTRISKAKVKVLLRAPFFAYKVMRMPISIGASPLGTAHTDGNSIVFDEKFIASLTDEELAGVLAHEAMHAMFGHHFRMGSREPRRWNIAADYTINQIILDGGLTLPSNRLLDDKYKGMYVEQVYDLLPPSNTVQMAGEGGGAGGENDPGGCGGVIHTTPMSAAQISAAEQQMKEDLAGALLSAKLAGNIPGELEKLVEGLIAAKVSWREILNQFMREIVTRSDYTWTRPNKRYSGSPFILPAMAKGVGGHIAVIVDTSGSTWGWQQQFLSEVNYITSECNLSVVCIYADTDVQEVEHFEAGEDIVLKTFGGGGTSFDAGFEWLQENDEDVSAIVYLTDAYGSCSLPSFDTPTIWAITPDGDRNWNPPFGIKIFIEE